MTEYLVIYSDPDQHQMALRTEAEVLRDIDMQDCHGAALAVYRLTGDGELERLRVHGPWAEDGRPLAVSLRTDSGEVVARGRCTDH